MKLRVKGNSLRFRLTRSDVARLRQSGEITETVYFGLAPEAELSYALKTCDSAQALSASYTAGKITVSISHEAVSRWAAVETEVGVYGSVETGREPLHLLIEKDFACLDASAEENQDTFPNPTQCQPLLR